MKHSEQNSFYLFPFLIKNSKIIISFTLVSAVFAGLLTFFSKPQYSSTAILFPPSGSSLEYSIENPNFGYDIEADRMLQILQSTELKDSIAKKFNMAAYYKLDTTRVEWKDILTSRIKKAITFERTRYMSIEITATTRNPELSADIVNYILSSVNKIRDRLYKTNLSSTVSILKEEYTTQKLKADSLLFLITQKGSSGKGFSLSQDKEGRYTVVVNRPEDIVMAQLVNQFIFEQNRTNDIHAKYENAKNQLKRTVPGVYVLDKAVPSYKKIGASYSKNIGIAVLGTILICIMVLYVKQEVHFTASKD